MSAEKRKTKRATRKKKVRAKIQRLGLILKNACEMANELMPDSTNQEKRDWVIALLNQKLDIPLLSEDQEEAVLGILVDVTCDLIFSRYKSENILAEETINLLLEK